MPEPPFKVETAADALDQIRVGGGHLLLTAHQRINEVRDALNAGHFTKAVEACNGLMQKVAQLAQAQAAMGLLADNTLVRVGELREGMIVPGVGPITDIGPCPNCGSESCDHVSFTVAGQVMAMDRNIEMVVELPE